MPVKIQKYSPYLGLNEIGLGMGEIFHNQARTLGEMLLLLLPLNN